MEKFIPKSKLSKKARKAMNLAQRKTWGCLNPITRRPENPKAYNRKKVRKGDDNYSPIEPFSISLFLYENRLNLPLVKSLNHCRYQHFKISN
jgi:hypothetical protein